MPHHPEPIAIVGLAAIMPDAPDAATFWTNLRTGRYSIGEVPAERWDPALYYDPDPRAPDKTYSRIGGWVREHPWDPIGWRLPVPPKVAAQMDVGQQWALAAARMALADAGWPGWTVDHDRVAVILGNAIGGEKHYATSMRIELPEVLRELANAPSFAALPEQVRASVLAETAKAYRGRSVEITEDSMPGELANVTAGRIANLFNFRGPNFTTDAACASGLAGIWSAVQGLVSHQFDVAVTGGIDRNMGVAAFVKFCKIGALSATGTRPFDAAADGFVMGEGAAVFVLKRLADAEAAGDRIYAVLLGIAGSSDGRGKGITAPNPAGQRIAIEQAWRQSGADPASATMLEAHGTSTRVGDAAELESLTAVFGPAGAGPGRVALGSVKSNIGHLKAAAGTAGLFKLAMSLHEKVLVPSLNFHEPNPNVDWASSPFRVNTELREWPRPDGDDVRRGAVSAFGFGGTNFHAVLEEYEPGRHAPRHVLASGVELPTPPPPSGRQALVLGGDTAADLATQLRAARDAAAAGQAPPPFAPSAALAAATVRVAIDYGSVPELAAKADKALPAVTGANPAMLRLLRAQGIFVGGGPAPKVAFLYPGQGSQYANMLQQLRAEQPIVAATFDEADAVTAGLLGRPLSSYIFVDGTDPAAVETLEQQLLRTEITQPAVLTADLALTRLLAAHGVTADMVMGHSLGEYGALVAAGALDFPAALEAVSARGREMAGLHTEDNGAMAAVFGPLPDIERIVDSADGYVVVANINSTSQAVVGGATESVERVVERFRAAGMTAVRIPVSHAFHTAIVSPATVPLQSALRRLDVRPPRLPIVANVTGEFYPAGADVDTMVDILGRQVASPVQFVRGLHTLYAAGARVFVEVGPKKALHGFVEDVLGGEPDDVLALFTNHPKLADPVSFNQALCGLYAAGIGLTPVAEPVPAPPTTPARTAMTTDTYLELGRLFADFLDRGRTVYERAAAPVPLTAPGPGSAPAEPVVVTGAALGLPGVPRVFDDENVGRILAGQQFIDTIPHRFREQMVDKRITRLVKPESGDPRFVSIESEADVVKLAGRRAPLDVVTEFGVEPARDAALDNVTRLALGAGFDALRDAGIPLVMRYRETTLGTRLPDRWGLPEELRDSTGVIFASAFPGYGEFARDLRRYYEDRARRQELATLHALRARMTAGDPAVAEADRRIAELEHALATEPFEFDRRFIFRALAMGHSQFAELIGARGPNTQVNAACASTTQSFALAEDWIRAGRCRRVVIVSADDVSGDELLPWVASGFLASGAAATDDVVADAATPFDRRRHGMIVGMGAAAVVIESADAARERGIRPICELLAAEVANSAFHGTRLDVDHVGEVFERVLRRAEARGIRRHDIAADTVFVSHETYTPARGGSASAEINALRAAFGPDADKIVIANTKGFTGHAMGAGIEDVVAIKSLETGIVPPVPNFKEPDPELGALNLSHGGAYPVEYALRLAAGFGSQVAMTVLRRTPAPGTARPRPDELGYRSRIADPALWQAWLARVSGRADPQLEVVQHRLRVVDPAAGTDAPAGAPAAAQPDVAEPEIAQPEVAQPAAAAARAQVQPAPVPEPEPGPVTAPAAGEVADAVVAIVAEMTGYPTELLDPDLDLEADLGVDTVKQAEVFAAVRQRFTIDRDEKLRLRDFPTLTHVIDWVRSKTTTEPAPEPAPAPAVETVTDDVADAVVAIVAEMTGYPTELLDPDLDLDLEADLGVDTVKQAEVFAAVRQRFTIDRDENLRLRDFPTLTHVIDWVRSRKAATAVPPATGDEEPAEPAPEPPSAGRYPRRIPMPVLRPPATAFGPTSARLADGDRVVVMLDTRGVGERLVRRLEHLGVTPLMLSPGIAAERIGPALHNWLEEGPVAGIYWLAALDDEGPLDALDLAGWHEALRRRVKSLATTVRAAYDHTPFLVTATAFGGYHGYDDAGATAPLGGAAAGFTKAYRREQPEALAKVVDVPPGFDRDRLAGLLVDETRHDPGCVEVGHQPDGTRWAIALADRPFPSDAADGLTLDAGTVFLVTGAAGSIVAAITADLATASGGTFHLLDLTPAPDPEDPDLPRYRQDPKALRPDIAARLERAGTRPTPVLIERELAKLERLAAAQSAIDAVTAAGGTAYYHQVDLTDPAAVAAVLAEVRQRSARIDVLLHAAGLEVSKALPAKTDREYDLVFDVKSDGWFNVLHAAADLPIRATVAFGSVAGRFGNAGQTDYSAANDLLAKITSSLRRSRPDTRALVVDWTAWAGIGMATRGSIPKVMELAGIEPLDPAVGVPWIRRELTASSRSGEVVVAGELGVLTADAPVPRPLERDGSGPMTGTVTADADGVTVHITLDPTVEPFLADHRIDGTAVLPGVMGIEAFAEAARLLAPGWQVAAVEDVDFLAPVKFYRDEPRTLTVRASGHRLGADVLVDCRLEAERTGPGGGEPTVTTHFTGAVRLSAGPAARERGEPVGEPAVTVPPERVYELYFHGPAYQVVGAAWQRDGAEVARLADALPPDHTAAAGTVVSPRLIELCFQTAGLWAAARHGRLALPRHVDRVRLLPGPAHGAVYAHAFEHGEEFDCVVRDHGGEVLLGVEGYRTVALADPVPEHVRQALTGAASELT